MRRSVLSAPAAIVVLGVIAATATAEPAPAAPAPTPAPAAAPPPAADAPPAEAPPAPPSADDLARAKAAFAEGKQRFDAGQLADAAWKFKESYRLSRNPLLLYNLGVTFDRLGESDLALLYYRKFLAEAPADDASAEQRRLAEGRVRELTAAAAVAAVAAPRYSAADVLHQVIEDAPPATPIDITASVPADAGWQIALHYRSAGAADFAVVPMKPRYRELVGRIPAAATRGPSVQYYLEVRDAAGGVVARIGRPSSPNLVQLVAGAQARFYPDLAPAGPAAETSPPTVGAVDPGPSEIRTSTWVATGTAGALVGAAIAFHIVAANASASLEAEAVLSRRGPCDRPPCRAYDDALAAVQRRGERFETLTTVSLGLGAAAAAVSGWLWYRDLTRERRPARSALMPVLDLTPGSTFVGGAAAVRF